MNLPGLITVKPEDQKTIKALAFMMGTSFLEELWTAELLSALDSLGTTDLRKLEISCAILEYNFIVGTPYECVYMLPDMSAGIGGYLSSELQGNTWNDLEDNSFDLMAKNVLRENEQVVLGEKMTKMKPISVFNWANKEARGSDFIHFFAGGVDRKQRGRGAFRKVITPFLNFADEHGLQCFLECYSFRLESLYKNFGFETVKRFEDPGFNLIERGMVRTPEHHSQR
jgi:hypothetical protein